MNINFFQLSVLLITIIILIYSWKRNRFLANFLLGALILISVSHLDFLDYKGTIDTLTFSSLMSGYSLLNFTYIVYNCNKESNLHMIYSCSFFIIFSLFVLFFVDYGKYYEYKFGTLIRVFISFFPLYVLTVYQDRKIRGDDPFNKNT